jgi:hypothetical protein
VTRPGVALAATLLGSTGLAAPGEACPAIEPDASASVSIEIAPGVEDEIQIVFFEDRDETGRVVGSNCYANVSVELSAFPSISNRLDTHGVARAIRESAAALGAATCEVSVWYEDTDDELTLGEECVTAEFGFSSSSLRTIRSEESCWSAEDLARMEEWAREREAEDARSAAEADAFAAAEDGIEAPGGHEEWGESLDEEAILAASEDVAQSTPVSSDRELFWAGN